MPFAVTDSCKYLWNDHFVLGLMTKVIKLESVKETGKFLIEIMPIMFIPAGVGLMTTWGFYSQSYYLSASLLQ